MFCLTTIIDQASNYNIPRDVKAYFLVYCARLKTIENGENGNEKTVK